MKIREIIQAQKTEQKLEQKFENFLDEMDEMLDLYDAGQRAWHKYDTEKNNAKVKIKSDKPVIILPVGDLHLGHIATDLNELIRHWREFLKVKNVYIPLMGDYVEHFILMEDVFGIFEQILTPDMQMHFFRKLIGIAPERILSAMASRGSQHDAQGESKLGYSLIANTLGEYNIPCLGNQGMLTVYINDIEYNIALAHHCRFNSYHNENHSPHQLMTVEFQDADCAVTAHKHTPAMQEQWFGGRLEHTIRCPTFKTGKGETKDRYSTKFWNSPDFIRHYCFVFYPDEKKIDTMRFEIAKQYLEWRE